MEEPDSSRGHWTDRQAWGNRKSATGPGDRGYRGVSPALWGDSASSLGLFMRVTVPGLGTRATGWAVLNACWVCAHHSPLLSMETEAQGEATGLRPNALCVLAP